MVTKFALAAIFTVTSFAILCDAAPANAQRRRRAVEKIFQGKLSNQFKTVRDEPEKIALSQVGEEAQEVQAKRFLGVVFGNNNGGGGTGGSRWQQQMEDNRKQDYYDNNDSNSDESDDYYDDDDYYYYDDDDDNATSE
eukprot:GHVU01120335.1.p1 GENE.GHVU01120335.1~~GHVU01120335.1.p1  ORF type:complete len:138 (+),score=32.78 GHVU01120335.1:85-498(+)